MGPKRTEDNAGPLARSARARAEGRPSRLDKFVTRQLFSREGEIHVPKEDWMAGHRGGRHRGAAPQRLHADRKRYGVANAGHERKREHEPGVESAEDGPQRG